MKFIRLGICALAAFAVAAHGAVENWSSAVLEVGSAVLLAYWGFLVFRGSAQHIRSHPLFAPLATFAGVVLFQLLLKVTVSPYAAKVELLRLFSYGVLLFLAVQAYRTLEDWRGFVWFLLVLGFVVSVFGILQHLTFNGKLYWVREMRYGGIPFGPYVNRNHFAGFVELVVPPGLAALVMGKVRRDQWMLVGVLTLFPIAALFLSASRGGIISFLVEIFALLLLIWLGRREQKQLLVGALVVLLAGGLVAWLGVAQALDRFSGYREFEVKEDKRVSMARDTWRIFLDHPIVGTGMGTFQSVFPKYETLYDGKIVNHAHNDYVEVLAETGVAGVACCAWFLSVLLVKGVQNVRNRTSALQATLQMGALVSCVGLLTHSLVDFNLHIPSNALLFFLLAGFASGHISGVRHFPKPAERTMEAEFVA
ncbi:MAG TPA: O-antigen ligase family protein [Candidatus Dormibacteraeota bacterium]|nr:O-antigen ligase family protein [Candidatus Dormibacteraeota bacterium]